MKRDDITLRDVTPASWMSTQRPGIGGKCRTPAAIRAMEEALAAVDRDVTATGAVSEPTIDQCRAARALNRGNK